MSLYSGCPVEKRGVETLCQFVDIGGKRQKVEFDAEIIWLKESETKLFYMHGGKILKEESAYNDFYGFLTSMQNVDEFKSLASRYSITQDSTLELIAVTRVFLNPVIETDSDRESNAVKPANHKSKYSYIPSEWRKEEPCEESESGKWWPNLQPVELATGTVWSSKRSDAENVAVASAFEAKVICSEETVA